MLQWAIVSACILLAIGFAVRAKSRIVQTLYIPASVLGGLFGIAAIQVAKRSGDPELASGAEPALRDSIALAATDIGSELYTWAGWLIAVVFAGLLLEKPQRRARSALRGAASAGAYAWTIILGEIMLGLLVVWLVIQPRYDVPPSFGQLIEAGFAGGHGTATALGAIFRDVLAFPEGLDLGLFMATVGLVASVIFGMVLVNIGVRRGWTASGRATVERVSGLEERRDPRPLGWARIRAEVLDPLAFQLVIVALAFGTGAALQWAFRAGVRNVLPSDYADAASYLDNVPLFLFTLIGGLMVRKTMGLLGVDDLIDADSIKRIVAVAMEFLIVAAIASMRVEAIATYLWPACVLIIVGCAWAVFCLVVLARRMLPREYWFELGIINFGMSTGTTAQGFMLLRIVDRDLETPAAEDYALAAPLSAPFVGGGLLTLSLPVILDNVPMPFVIAALAGGMAVAMLVGMASRRNRG